MWSDRTQWVKVAPTPPPPPPPPLPAGAIDPGKVKTVLVVQSCHLDVQRGGPEQLVFTVHPILLDLYFDCPEDFPHLPPFASVGATTPEPLLCPDVAAMAAVAGAIEAGIIVFDASATSAEPELYGPSVFTASLGIAVRLARRFSVTAPRSMSQRDVPGMTRGVIPLMSAAGVAAISVGANCGSAAPLLPGYNLSRLSQLSTPFVWRDAASSTSVIHRRRLGNDVPLADDPGLIIEFLE